MLTFFFNIRKNTHLPSNKMKRNRLTSYLYLALYDKHKHLPVFSLIINLLFPLALIFAPPPPFDVFMSTPHFHFPLPLSLLSVPLSSLPSVPSYLPPLPDAQPTEAETAVWNQVSAVLEEAHGILAELQSYNGAGQEIREVSMKQLISADGPQHGACA